MTYNVTPLDQISTLKPEKVLKPLAISGGWKAGDPWLVQHSSVGANLSRAWKYNTIISYFDLVKLLRPNGQPLLLTDNLLGWQWKHISKSKSLSSLDVIYWNHIHIAKTIKLCKEYLDLETIQRYLFLLVKWYHTNNLIFKKFVVSKVCF